MPQPSGKSPTIYTCPVAPLRWWVTDITCSGLGLVTYQEIPTSVEPLRAQGVSPWSALLTAKRAVGTGADTKKLRFRSRTSGAEAAAGEVLADPRRETQRNPLFRPTFAAFCTEARDCAGCGGLGGTAYVKSSPPS